jgi:hypothetical protein
MLSRKGIVKWGHRRLALTGIVILGVLTALGSGGGGGGGDGVPTNPANITSDNAVDVASEATAAFWLIDLVGVYTDFPYGASLDSHQPTLNLLKKMLDLVRGRLNDIKADGVDIATGVHVQLGVLCDSGSLTFDWNDANGNDLLSVGETIQITYNNCYEAADNTTWNGKTSLTLNSLTGNPQNDAMDWSFKVTMQFNDNKITDEEGEGSINGSVIMSASNNVSKSTLFQKLEGTSLTMKLDGESGALKNYTISLLVNKALGTYEADADYTLAETFFDGMVTVVTDPVFSGPYDLGLDEAGNPTSGKMTISGSENSTLTVNPMMI